MPGRLLFSHSPMVFAAASSSVWIMAVQLKENFRILPQSWKELEMCG